MDSLLCVGPKHAQLEQRAFQRADDIATGSLSSVLYITRNDTRRRTVEDTWAASHDLFRLRAETLDAVVREWYEELQGLDLQTEKMEDRAPLTCPRYDKQIHGTSRSVSSVIKRGYPKRWIH